MKRRLNRMHWSKQLFPRTLYSIQVDDEGKRWLVLWRQWLWQAYDRRRVPVLSHPA